MVTEGPAEVLHGRRVEREALGRLLESVRGAQSRVLVVCGEAGVGKTALLDNAIGSASGFRVMRAAEVVDQIRGVGWRAGFIAAGLDGRRWTTRVGFASAWVTLQL